MKILSQRSPTWSGVRIGKAQIYMYRYGCTITCCSMLTDYFSKYNGTYKDPGHLARALQFTLQGLIIWQSLPNETQFKLEKRLKHRSDSSIQKSLNNPYTAVILQVDGYHWVLATGKSLGGHYKIADPWTGKRSTTKAYGSITGSAHMKLTVIPKIEEPKWIGKKKKATWISTLIKKLQWLLTRKK